MRRGREREGGSCLWEDEREREVVVCRRREREVVNDKIHQYMY